MPTQSFEEHRSSQPWARPERSVPVDRAYLEELMDRWERVEAEREERLYHYLQWLSVRWALIWAALGVIIGLLWLIFHLVTDQG